MSNIEIPNPKKDHFNKYDFYRPASYTIKRNMIINDIDMPDNLKKIIKHTSYKPCDFLLDSIRKHKDFNFSMADIKDDLDIFVETYIPEKVYKALNEQQLITLYTDVAKGLLELAKYYIADEKHKLYITYHAAYRYSLRYSNNYNLDQMINSKDLNIKITTSKENIALFFKKLMYPMLNKIYTKGKDPYKFKKTNRELADYLENKKKSHGNNIKIKVYGDAIWIFEMQKDIAVLKTMYAIPMRFFYRPPENEKIESFYNILASEDLLGRKILLGNAKKAQIVVFYKRR